METALMQEPTTVFDVTRPWTAKDVSHYLGYTPRHVYQLARDGMIPGKKCGNRWYFDPMKVRAFAGMGV